MNFLAHLYLSADSELFMIGNFIGDFVKGNKYLQFPHEMQQGLLMHRKIDSFTDSHEVVKQSIQRLRPKYGKFAGIIVDVFYDHFLASNWETYHQLALADFTQYVYDTLQVHEEKLPIGVQRLLPYMIEQNWLLNYAEVAGIQRTLQGLDKRTTIETHLANSIIDLEQLYDEFATDFKKFFPSIQQYVNSQLADRDAILLPKRSVS